RLAGPDDATGNLATIGDQDLFEFARIKCHIKLATKKHKIHKFVSCAFCAFWWLTANTEKGLAVLDGLPVLNVNFNDLTSCFSLNLVHEFHGFDNTHDRLRLDVAADLHKRVGGRRSRTIERAH